MGASDFIDKLDKKGIKSAIESAEKSTSGEIRIRIEKECAGLPLDRALKIFKLLKMENTKDRNGVLLYIAWQDRKIAICGDKGINDVVPKEYWKMTLDALILSFAKGLFSEGIQAAVLDIGERLQHFFPYQSDDINELPDEISFEKLDEE